MLPMLSLNAGLQYNQLHVRVSHNLLFIAFLCVFFSFACCSSVSWQELSSGVTAKCFEFSQLLYDIYNDDLIQLQHCACVMLTVI